MKQLLRQKITNFKLRVRSKTVESIKGVSKVIPQNTLDYSENLTKIKPDFVVHGDDWKSGVQSAIRQKVIDLISDWGGKLIEPKYTEGILQKLITKLKNLELHQI